MSTIENFKKKIEKKKENGGGKEIALF